MQIKSKHSNKKSLFISVLGGLSYGVPVATISGVLGEPKFEALSQAERAFISSSLMYGILIGTFLAFLLIDYFGRRKLIIFFGLESFLFALLLSAMDTPASIITMRLIQGIGVGAIQTISPIYSLELASDDWKGMFVLLFQVHITIGYIIGYTLNIIFNYVTDGWRYEFGLAGIPIFIYSVGTIFLTESDVYKKKNADNISKQKQIKERKSNKLKKKKKKYIEMQEITGDNNNGNQQQQQIQEIGDDQQIQRDENENNQQQIKENDNNKQQQTNQNKQQKSENDSNIDNEILTEKTKIQEFVSIVKFLVTKCRRQLIVGLCLPFLDQFSGVNIIVFYTPIILQMAKLKTRIQSLSVNLGLAGWDTLFTLPPLTMIERAGRRTCLIIGQSMTSIGMLLIAIGYLVPALVEKDIQYVLCIPGLVLFVAGYEFGSGGVFYVLMAEMFPSYVAGVMSSLIMLLLQICAVIIVTGFEPLTKAVSEGAVFTFLTVVNVIYLLFSIFVIQETKGKQLWNVKMEEGEQTQNKQENQEQNINNNEQTQIESNQQGNGDNQEIQNVKQKKKGRKKLIEQKQLEKQDEQ